MAYTGNSIVDYLNSTGQASDYNTRAKLAQQNGISGYTGTAQQNTQLLGLLNKPAPATPTVSQPNQSTSYIPPVSSPTPSSTPPANSGGYSMGTVNLNGNNSQSSPSLTPPIPNISSNNISSPNTAPVPTPTANTTSNNTPSNSYSMGSINVTPTGVSSVTPGNQSTPAIPTNYSTNTQTSTTGVATPPINSASSTSNELLQKLLTAMTPSSQETDLMTKLATLEAQRQGFTDSQYARNLNGEEAIATPYISGQTVAQSANVDRLEQPLQANLSVLQNNRNLAANAAKAGLDYAKPTEVGIGGSLINPLTGETVALGQSYSAKQGSANVLQLSKTYPDAGILPTDSPDIAAQKASNAPSFVAKFGKSSYQWNPNTGSFDLLNTNRLGTTDSSANYSGNPNGNGTTPSSTNFGVSTSNSGGYQAGMLTSLLQSQGRTADPTTLQSLWQQYGNGGSYSNDVAHNAVIYNAMQGGGNTQASAQGSAQARSSGGSSSIPSGGIPTNPLSKLSSADQIYATTGDPNAAKLYPAQIGPAAARIQAALPGWTPVNAKAAAKFYESPKTQTFIANSNTVLNTLDEIKKVSATVPRGSIQLLNNGILSLKQGVSDPNAAKLVQLSSLLGDEVGKILGSGQGSDFTIQLGNSMINPNYSQSTFTGTVDQLAGRVHNKVQEYLKQGGQQTTDDTSGGTDSSGSSNGGSVYKGITLPN